MGKFMGSASNILFTILAVYCILIDGTEYQIRTCDIKAYLAYQLELVEDPDSMPANQIVFAEEEIQLLARVIMSEAGTLPLTGKIAVLATIINRVYSDKFPDTIYDVIMQETVTASGEIVRQYSINDNGDPTEECFEAIEVFTEDMFPSDMFYFRTEHPHSFGHFYIQIGNTYFSTDTDYLNP